MRASYLDLFCALAEFIPLRISVLAYDRMLIVTMNAPRREKSKRNESYSTVFKLTSR